MADNTGDKQSNKLDTAKIGALASVIIVATKAAGEVWEALNKDDRISDQVRTMVTNLQDAGKKRSPVAALRAQLDEIDRYATDAQQGKGARLVREAQAAGWQARATQIRAKLPLVETMNRRERGKHLRSLQTRTRALLNEILAADLENGVD
ncbi:hypothetical protein ACSDQ9_03765 [Aestuariimicrobium soli]|uniref:hypothetical protein n=1 Tax=Aestuariimicrobium soli TaxID=2035834 RepID=UPI003EBBFB60